MNITAINAVFDVIQKFLPMLGPTGSAANVVIDVLQEAVPLAINWTPAIIEGYKNITEALKADPATSAEQLAKIDEFDAMVDAAYDAAKAAVNPDA